MSHHPVINAAPNAVEGEVLRLGSSWTSSSFAPTDAVLCRNNAPLIGLALWLYAQGVPCRLAGRDLLAGLDKILSKGKDTADWKSALARQGEKQVDALRAKRKFAQAYALEDRYHALARIANGCVRLDEIKAKLERLTSAKSGVLLSTIHRAKGLEWPTVFILDFHLLPARWAEREWEKKQERNLQYIATTRAKTKLVFIQSK